MIENFTDLNTNDRYAILGIGNKFRGDDAIGVRVIEEIRKRIDSPRILLINAKTVPEKFTSKVKDFEPDHTLLIDSIDMGEDPGTVSIVDPEEITNQKISSHRLPLSMLMQYLEDETEAESTLIGIQAGRTEMGNEISEDVRETINYLVKVLEDNLI
ncbi:hypothetical protein AKJ52_00240 [candidate division MSBL1 archaeon SCGC-AAA382C18]|uniref:Hydrogenase maturation protease n=1 Tax=candidate division MSBL1 archaeon SCGC-AAA382C18 TaxID=1698281 RepID=A0A133VLX9_9EURY|nr:hypothetical protein AKJ52_00240 [candidate division MSBL1 archaeon SCGC-AAA382C18]